MSNIPYTVFGEKIIHSGDIITLLKYAISQIHFKFILLYVLSLLKVNFFKQFDQFTILRFYYLVPPNLVNACYWTSMLLFFTYEAFICNGNHLITFYCVVFIWDIIT